MRYLLLFVLDSKVYLFICYRGGPCGDSFYFFPILGDGDIKKVEKRWSKYFNEFTMHINIYLF